MGREVRRVPPNWDHPKKEGYSDGRFQPMYDETFEHAAADWKRGFAAWECGERPEYCSEDSKALEYWEYESDPPNREYYRPWKDEEATWFQVWETVTEGTPVTPPFATKDDLVDYLAESGDFWDQLRGSGPWDRPNAEKFVNAGWAPSLMMVGGKVFEARDGMPPADR